MAGNKTVFDPMTPSREMYSSVTDKITREKAKTNTPTSPVLYFTKNGWNFFHCRVDWQIHTTFDHIR